MEAITSTPGLLALFSGHDHGDTWCYRWDKKLPGMTFQGNGISKSIGHVQPVPVSDEIITDLCFGQYV